MRVISHCANHPSKDAGQRCYSCRKWLCEACVQRFGTHVYCGQNCHLTGVSRDVLRSGLVLARKPLHPAWVLAITAAATAVMVTAVALHVAKLISVSDLQLTHEFEIERAQLVAAEVFYGDQGRILRIEGTPGTRVVMLDNEQPIEVMTVGDQGAFEGQLADAVGDSQSVRLITLSESTVDLDLSKVPPPSPTPTPSPTNVPRPTVIARTATVRPVVAAGPTPILSPPVLQLVTDAGPRIALTFDGNASSNGTGELLDLLHDLDLEVTLFVTGQFIDKYPGIIRRAVLSGHEVGNHTYSHPHLTTYEQNRRHSMRNGVTRERFQNELRRTEMAFRKATGRAMMPLWRAPYGEENRTLRGWALEMGYLHIRWSSLEGASLDSRDWVADEHSSLFQNSSTMMERLLSFPELRGGIVLMHLATDRDEPPWEALPTFVESLRKRDVTPTTVIGLLESSAKWRPWLLRAQTRHRETFEP
ncbi:MAG: polysaccharide deacetylase family protein [Acidobacteriota bacterium]|nr:polysaccharide deacetylase family protein [Acidobacteriota bacterium]